MRCPLAPPQTEQARWFADEVHAHEGQLRAYLRATYPTVQDVGDLVQESFLRTWKARLAHPIASTKSFLVQVARNLAIDVVRKKLSALTDSLVDLGFADPDGSISSYRIREPQSWTFSSTFEF